MIKFQQTRENRDMDYVEEALQNDRCGVRGHALDRCVDKIREHIGVQNIFMTNSATMALDLAAQSLPKYLKGGEVIIPSWTFATTASPFLRAGFKPVFVDVDYDTLTMTVDNVEAALSPETAAVVVVHYAGIAANILPIKKICDDKNIYLIEDAAPAYLTPGCGMVGDYAVFSFNDTKNIGCGEGGALIVNTVSSNPKIANIYLGMVDELFNKGTNVSAVRRGEIEQYTWTDSGLAPQMTNLTAALLLDELGSARMLTERRLSHCASMRKLLNKLSKDVKQMPFDGNGHFYWLLFPTPVARKIFIELMKVGGVETSRHYMALHESPMGKNHCTARGSMAVSTVAEKCIVRLPIHTFMSSAEIELIADQAIKCAAVALSAASLST